VKVQEPVLFEVSVAVQVTVAVPLLKVEPEGGLQLGVSVPSQLSLAVAV
jgi:hypothetical protein